MFYQKEKRYNGEMEGVQSFNNKKTYVVLYDENKNKFVGKWVDTPKFRYIIKETITYFDKSKGDKRI